MAKRVLLLGLRPDFMDEFRRQLRAHDLELIAGGGVDDARRALADGDLDHVFLGGGLPLEARLETVKLVFDTSQRATVHLKDQLSGPEGYVAFVRSVLDGLADYHPVPSPNAIRPDSNRSS